MDTESTVEPEQTHPAHVVKTALTPQVVVLHHHDLARVGARADLSSRSLMPVGRDFPEFMHPETAVRTTLGDPTVSRRQLEVEWSGTAFRVRCCGRLPIEVIDADGRVTAAEWVRPGAMVAIGDRSLLLLDFRRRSSSEDDRQEMVGETEVMWSLRDAVRRAAAVDSPTLVVGDTGTGKELVAAALHARCARHARALKVVNCAGLREGTAIAQLFGSVKGGYTDARNLRGFFEEASGGVLFLDEIGELPGEIQAALLRCIQHGEIVRVGSAKARTVDVRVLAATHRDLPALMRAGAFREDLYHRLNALHLTVPPLRRRRADIPLLFARFARQHPSIMRFSGEPCRAPPGIPLGAVRRLLEADWPGNVRQLEHLVTRASAENQESAFFTLPELEEPSAGEAEPEEELRHEAPQLLLRGRRSGPPARPELLTELKRHDFDRTETAKAFGVARSTLYNWMKALGIEKGNLDADTLRRTYASMDGDQRATAHALGLSLRGLKRKANALGVEL